MDFDVMLLLTVAVALSVLCFVLWRRQRKTTGKVEFLFNALDNGDYTFRFPEGKAHGGDTQIGVALNRVKDILQHARDEQKEQEKYYELIIDSVDTAIIVADSERGIVTRHNKAARKMLHRESITHLSQVAEQMKSLSVRETHATLKGRQMRIIALSDIKRELADQEIDSWAKLTRVLTHEIMNAITPIISLSDTLLRQTEGEQHEGLRAINSTGKELMRFVENYRKFTKVPTPAPTLFYVKPFIERMARMARPMLKAGCTIDVTCEPKDLLVYADEGLVSRVVTNLLKNAAEATTEGQHVWLNAYTGEGDTVIIDVADDGLPIPDDVAAHIFVPFFTTKKDGSGIGLSISRQIMRASNGFISLVTDDNNGLTIFRLTFN